MSDNPLYLRTKAGGVISLYREEEISDWLDRLHEKKPHTAATWRGFEIIAYKRHNDTTWEKC
jgi:hypothetical protein